MPTKPKRYINSSVFVHHWAKGKKKKNGERRTFNLRTLPNYIKQPIKLTMPTDANLHKVQ